MTTATVNDNAYGKWRDRINEQVELVAPHENGRSMWVKVKDRSKPVSLPLRWLDVKPEAPAVCPACGQAIKGETP